MRAGFVAKDASGGKIYLRAECAEKQGTGIKNVSGGDGFSGAGFCSPNHRQIGRNAEVAAVPGESGVRGMSLCAPGLVCFDALPFRVVVGRSSPAQVIAKVELPFAIERHSAAADVFDGENGHAIGSCVWLQGSDGDCGVAQ